MGFLSNVFGRGNVALAEPLAPIQTVTVERERKGNTYQQLFYGKENAYDVKKQKGKNKHNNGWFKRKKKNNRKNRSGVSKQRSAPKLSLFLQQTTPDDDRSQNHTLDTGSLTASLSASLNSSPSAKLDAISTNSSNALHVITNTRPTSAHGVEPPPLHESFPINDLHEASDSDSEQDTIDASSPEPLSLDRKQSDGSANSDFTQDISDEDLSPESSSSKQHVIGTFGKKEEVSSNLDLPLYNKTYDDFDPALEGSDVSSNQGGSPRLKVLNNYGSTLVPPSLHFRPEHSYYGDNTSIVDSEDAVESINKFENESLSNDLIFLDLHESSKDITELLFPHASKFHSSNQGSDLLSAVGSLDALDDNSLGNGSANADISFQLGKSKLEDNQVENIQVEFDLDFLKSKTPLIRTNKTNIERVVAQSNEEIENTDHRSFEDIVTEVEETIENSHKQNLDNGPWIANGLLSNLGDDLSSTQISTISFTSDDFKEEESNVISPQIPTILEEDEGSNDPIDAAMERGRMKSLESKLETTEGNYNVVAMEPKGSIMTKNEKELSKTIASIIDSNLVSHAAESITSPVRTITNAKTVSSPQLNTNRPSPPRSALLSSRNLARPEFKKTVSWNDENDVFTYLPAQAQDLQKARDLVATYGKILDTLNAQRLSSVAIKNNSCDDEKSDADLSEASSVSVESLLSALSHDSSISEASVKIALEQIAQETMKLVPQEQSISSLKVPQLAMKIETKEGIQHSENTFPDVVGTNGSSSSFETIVSALSNASSQSNDAMKSVIKRLKEEAEKQLFLSSQKLEEAKVNILKEAEDSSVSSVESLTSSASSTGTSKSVKELMAKLKNERFRQVQVFSSTRDMFSLLHNNTEKEEAIINMIDNDWIGGCNESGSSSSLSTLLSADPNSSASTAESSDSVLRMMSVLKNERERIQHRRNKIRSVREFVDSVCCIPSNPHIVCSSKTQRRECSNILKGMGKPML